MDSLGDRMKKYEGNFDLDIDPYWANHLQIKTFPRTDGGFMQTFEVWNVTDDDIDNMIADLQSLKKQMGKPK